MRNKKLAKEYQAPCIICECDGEGDHILPLGMGGKYSRDDHWNLWSLCRAHHLEKGESLTRFVEKYRLWDVLKEKGFYWLDSSRKYWHELA